MSKLHDIEMEIDIHASKAEVWDLLFNRFGEVNDFNPLIEASHHEAGTEGEVGCERKCEITPGNWVHEKITRASGTNEFDIDILEGGLPMMDKMGATVRLQKLGEDRTRVKMTLHVSTKPAFLIHAMRGKMKKQFFNLLIGLKNHLETGTMITKQNIKGISQQYFELPKSGRFQQSLMW